MTDTTAHIAVPGAGDSYFRTDYLARNLGTRAIRGGAVTLSAQCIKFALQTASTAVLARMLTPRDFGLIAMVSAFTNFITMFKDLGLSMAVIQQAEINHAQVSTLFWINIGISVLLMGAAAALSPLVAWFYSEPRLTGIMFAVAGTFIFGGLTALHTALLRRHMRFASLAMVEIVSMAAGIIAAITLAWMSTGYWALVAMGIVTGLINAVLVWILSPWRPGLPQRAAGIGPMLRFGGNLTGFNILNYFTRNFDNVLIGWASGAGSLGVYSRAYSLLMMPIRQINGPLTAVAVPALSRLQRDPNRYREYYLKAVGTIAFLGMPIVVFAAIDADLLVRVFLGPQWSEASTVFRLLAPAAFVGTFNVAPGWLFSTLGRTDRLLTWGFISAPITTIGFLVGIKWGTSGVAASFSITFCALYIALIPYSCVGTPIRPWDVLRQLAEPAIASLAGGALLGAFSPLLQYPTFIHLLGDAALYAAVYLLFCLLLPAGRRFISNSLPVLGLFKG